jgi:hypothetical protein
LLEIFFGVIQAYIFMMLSMVYLGIATHTDDHPETSHSDVPITKAASESV